jgi:hypothetical protein
VEGRKWGGRWEIGVVEVVGNWRGWDIHTLHVTSFFAKSIFNGTCLGGAVIKIFWLRARPLVRK